MGKLHLSCLFILIFYVGNAQYLTFDLPTPISNQYGQTILKTQDDNFLILAQKYCYSPGTTYIEGCPNGCELIKVNAIGDTIWMKHLNHHLYSKAHIFENQDGTFTIISQTPNSYSCGDVYIALWGWMKIFILNISANGEFISQTSYPNECELKLRDVIRIADKKFAILAEYEETDFYEVKEGRLYIMDNNANILHTYTFPLNEFNGPKLFLNNDDEIGLFYSEQDTTMYLQYFDDEANLLRSHSMNDLQNSCFAKTGPNIMFSILPNGDLFVLCSDRYSNTEILTLRHDLEILAHRSYIMSNLKSLLLFDQQDIIISAMETSDLSDTEIQLFHFTTSGDSVGAKIIALPKNQQPTDMIELENKKLAIVGNENCCNKSTGPGLTFLYLGDLLLDTNFDTENKSLLISPNPATEFITFQFEDGLYRELDVAIYSITGQQVMKKTMISDQSISVSELADGYFFISVIDNRGICFRKGFVKVSY